MPCKNFCSIITIGKYFVSSRKASFFQRVINFQRQTDTFDINVVSPETLHGSLNNLKGVSIFVSLLRLINFLQKNFTSSNFCQKKLKQQNTPDKNWINQ